MSEDKDISTDNDLGEIPESTDGMNEGQLSTFLTEEEISEAEIAKEALGLQAINTPVVEDSDDEGGDLPEYRIVRLEKIPKLDMGVVIANTLQDLSDEGYDLLSHSSYEGYKSVTENHILIFCLVE